MIRPVSPAEYPAALKVIGDAFGIVVQPPTVHTAVGEDPDGHFLVAERDGAIVGTGASVGFGPTGWIGGDRGGARGARRAARAGADRGAIEALGPRETLLLLASDAGRPIYERLGFEAEERYRVFWSPPDAAPAADGLRRLTAADRDGRARARRPRHRRDRARWRSTSAARARSRRRTCPRSRSSRRGRRSRSSPATPTPARRCCAR